jgi:proteasome lid subunit RPN8/RPN11
VARAVTLRLSDALVSEIRREGELAYPRECCGVLAGQAGPIKEVQRFVPMQNQRTDDPHRYLISPEELRRVTAELESSGLEILGIYHSHPDHPAAPSKFDLDHAWPWYSYVILRVDQGRAAELTSWELEDDRRSMQPESIEVFSEV